ncbi:hypothetical protein AJ78_04102 [Emergomyces pasteurianus Ep9510]|uniref:Protein phosphatase 4 core regulatory subunit R2 n=1 Tax=Emergomyces pasteurianus Ep9510 TaxID=1447872 RepID=A0A1J9PGT7_9EURO|nr:hypothetical protein AJ78_04102 [Emergomyces pasteurianus Ep9510]
MLDGAPSSTSSSFQVPRVLLNARRYGDEEVLELVAKDGTMDNEKWPSLLDPLIERLEQIVHNDFPLPIIPPALSTTVDTSSLTTSSYPAQEANSQANSNKENAPPSQLQSPPRRPPVPTFPSSASSERVPDSQPQSGPTDDALPPPLVAILSSIKSTLKAYFSAQPPHTIQRLAELILRPTLHYRTVPAYLRAVDRVVSVSSGAHIFPLPLSMPLPGGMIDTNLVNGVNGTGSGGFMFSDNDALGSDESLGGALLTPIPWLSNSALPGGNIGDGFVEPDFSPNSSPGASSPSSSNPSSPAVPPRESGAVTQGELIRQEQEAGVVPTTMQHQNQHQNQRHNQRGLSLMAEGDDVEAQGGELDEVPHARGPNILGVEDMGLQDGRGLQMSLSTNHPHAGGVRNGGSATDVNDTVLPSVDNDKFDGVGLKDDADRDADGDIVIGDMPGEPEDGTDEDQTRSTTTMPATELKPESDGSTKSELETDEQQKGSSIEGSGNDNRMDT